MNWKGWGRKRLWNNLDVTLRERRKHEKKNNNRSAGPDGNFGPGGMKGRWAHRLSLLSCPHARQLYRTESLQPPEYPVTAAVFRYTVRSRSKSCCTDWQSTNSERPAVVTSQTYTTCNKNFRYRKSCLMQYRAWRRTGEWRYNCKHFYVGIRWELLAVIPLRFTSGGKTSGIPLDMRLCVPHRRYGLCSG